ncbi:hypothetical protein [Phenylobacterium sp. J367]|uniref:hypothetical protein n=1 Tax=Phenylobacterium sp. J367 TaxID=2898435 RepID=UPI002151668A|nr:hypothetical protein [Phenylobacterium sp. J367]MCR5877734.1 hypothetical protein [Phenylobacterium sp. J367]
MAQRKIKHEPSNIIPFPGRREPVAQDAAPRGPFADNVRPIRPAPEPLPPEPLPASGYVLLAILEALNGAKRSRRKAGGPDVLAELVEMYWRWEHDAEVRKGVARAINLVMASKTGRW